MKRIILNTVALTLFLCGNALATDVIINKQCVFVDPPLVRSPWLIMPMVAIVRVDDEVLPLDSTSVLYFPSGSVIPLIAFPSRSHITPLAVRNEMLAFLLVLPAWFNNEILVAVVVTNRTCILTDTVPVVSLPQIKEGQKSIKTASD